MTISNSPIILTNDWIQRTESLALSGNKLRAVKAKYLQETPKISTMVSTLQLGTFKMEQQEGWHGISQTHKKFLTSVDIGKGICHSLGSTLIMNSFFIPAERECSINICAFLMYGTSDDARQLQRFRQFFTRPENSHHKKFFCEWLCNSLASAEELIISIINLRMFVTLEEFYNYFGSYSKLLTSICKRDQVTLAVKISEDRTKLILHGMVWVRKESKMITADSLNFRTNYWVWEGSKFKTTRICTIDRNDFCTIRFESEELYAKVEKDYDDYLNIKVKLQLIDEHVTVMVLCLDKDDVTDMLEAQSTPLQTIAVKLQDCLMVCVCRQLPSFVTIDPELKIDPNSSEPIFKEEILYKMISNYHINNCGVTNFENFNRYEVIKPAN